MRPAFGLCAPADPEERLVVFAESGVGVRAGLLRRHLHHDGNAERLEGGAVKGLRPLHIGDSKADMVNHERTPYKALAFWRGVSPPRHRFRV
jgi:hypothetical protein